MVVLPDPATAVTAVTPTPLGADGLDGGGLLGVEARLAALYDGGDDRGLENRGLLVVSSLDAVDDHSFAAQQAGRRVPVFISVIAERLHARVGEVTAGCGLNLVRLRALFKLAGDLREGVPAGERVVSLGQSRRAGQPARDLGCQRLAGMSRHPAFQLG